MRERKEQPAKEEELATTAVVSFLVRLNPSEDGQVRGVARHVQSGVETPFNGTEDLHTLLLAQCQTPAREKERGGS
jgi:hypothetical protein